MFRSKCTLEEYMNSLEDVGAAPEDIALDDLEESFLHGHENDEDREQSFDDDNHFNLDPSNVRIPNGFNDNEEVLIIDGDGIAMKRGGKINIKIVYALDPPNKIMVPLNKFYQPIRKAGSLFNRFLAEVARRSNLCPLNYKDWRLVPRVLTNRIINYIRTKFLLPMGDKVDKKVLSFVGDKLRGYKRHLRIKYIKEGTTKEELYKLPESGHTNSDTLARPKGVPDTMWINFVDMCFSERFQKYSNIGKKARAKQLHYHTCGSQSFAIKREKFEKENKRTPGPIEWFRETHQTKEKTYHSHITQKFMNSAMKIVEKKTNTSNVVLSDSTVNAESFAYQKLMGIEKHGRVKGYGNGVYYQDVYGRYGQTEIDMATLLQKMQDMQKEIDDLSCKKNAQTPIPIEDELREETSNHQSDEHYRWIMGSDKVREERISMPLKTSDRTQSIKEKNHGHNQDGMTLKASNHEKNRKENENEHTQVMDKRTPFNLSQNGTRHRILAPSSRQNIEILCEKEKHFNGSGRNGDTIAVGATNLTLLPSTSSHSHHFQPFTQEHFKSVRENFQISNIIKKPLLKMDNHMEGKEKNHRALNEKGNNHGQHVDEQTLNKKQSSGNGKSHAEVDLTTLTKKRELSHMQSAQEKAKRQKQIPINQMSRPEIEILLDKVLKDNPEMVAKFQHGKKRAFIHCFLGGVAMSESKNKADPDMLSKFLWDKLYHSKDLQQVKRNAGKDHNQTNCGDARA